MHTRTRSLSVNWTTTTGSSGFSGSVFPFFSPFSASLSLSFSFAFSLFTRPARVALLKFFLLVCTACCVNSMEASTLESYKIVEYTARSMEAIVTWTLNRTSVSVHMCEQVWTSVNKCEQVWTSATIIQKSATILQTSANTVFTQTKNVHHFIVHRITAGETKRQRFKQMNRTCRTSD